MDQGRRKILWGLATAGGAMLGGTAAASASGTTGLPSPPGDAVGMLYDTTLCIGCKTCVVACKEANGQGPDEDGPYEKGLYDQPLGLSEDTKTVIQYYRSGRESSYVKRQCMHCVDPACAAACMFGALRKGKGGVVSWDGDKCVGCRYCQIGCPYNVPRFQWTSKNPRIVKCEMCSHRLAEGDEPACTEVCPRQAVIFGRREDLLQEARKRIAAHPDRYVPRIYGEEEGGGTQVLYLSHVPFEKLGLPDLGSRSSAAEARSVQHTLYKGFVAPVALYGVLCAVILRTRRQHAAAAPREDSDMEPQEASS